jgi:glycosyltransferase involved in cell wall biosynthesis
MSPQPLVSIVIPVFNGSDYLADAIDSALAQTYANVEVLVVNDGSADGGATDRIARAYLPRIRYFEQPNGGVAAALNRGIREAGGEYVAWLSHDDTFTPDKLARQVEILEARGDSRLVLFGDYEVDDVDSGRRFEKHLPAFLSGERVTENLALLFLGHLHGCTLLIPAHAFAEAGLFDVSRRTTQDYDLWFRLLRAGFRFAHAPGTVVRTRWHAAQGSRALGALHLEECTAMFTAEIERWRPQLGALPVHVAVRIARTLSASRLQGPWEAFLRAWTGTSRLRRTLRVALAPVLSFHRREPPSK